MFASLRIGGPFQQFAESAVDHQIGPAPPIFVALLDGPPNLPGRPALFQHAPLIEMQDAVVGLLVEEFAPDMPNAVLGADPAEFIAAAQFSAELALAPPVAPGPVAIIAQFVPRRFAVEYIRENHHDGIVTQHHADGRWRCLLIGSRRRAAALKGDRLAGDAGEQDGDEQ